MAGPSEKGALFQALKAAGQVDPDRHYRTYTLAELRDKAQSAGLNVVVPTAAPVAPRPDELAEIRSMVGDLASVVGQLARTIAQPAPAPAPAAAPRPAQPQPQPQPRQPALDPNLHAGVTLNTHAGDQVIEVDAQGRQWYQKEVNKPGFPKPRGRRVLRDMAPGTVVETIKVNGGYTESFEVPGDRSSMTPVEIKVTLPSYQTGIYKEPGIPFKVHTYNGARGFDWDEVNRFYGGADLVPSDIKKIYVSSDLCYDITTTIRAIQKEYRESVLKSGSNA